MKEGVSGENTQFLGIGGEYFESLKDAIEFVDKYKKYFYQEDIDKMLQHNVPCWVEEVRRRKFRWARHVGHVAW